MNTQVTSISFLKWQYHQQQYFQYRQLYSDNAIGMDKFKILRKKRRDSINSNTKGWKDLFEF